VIDDLGFDAADVKAQTDGWVQTMKVRNALHFVSRQPGNFVGYLVYIKRSFAKTGSG
jgi:hypothetical protein